MLLEHRRVAMRLKLIVLVLLVLFWPWPRYSESSVFFQTDAGLAFVVEPRKLSRSWARGVMGGGGVGYCLNDYVTLIGSFSYTHFSFTGENLGLSSPPEYEIIQIKGERSYLVTTSVDLRLRDPKVTNQYLLVGAGFLIQRIGRVEIHWWDFVNHRDGGTTRFPDLSDRSFFLMFGTGFEFRPSERFTLSIEASALAAPDVENLYVPLKLGLRF